MSIASRLQPPLQLIFRVHGNAIVNNREQIKFLLTILLFFICFFIRYSIFKVNHTIEELLEWYPAFPGGKLYIKNIENAECKSVIFVTNFPCISSHYLFILLTLYFMFAFRKVYLHCCGFFVACFLSNNFSSRQELMYTYMYTSVWSKYTDVPPDVLINPVRLL